MGGLKMITAGIDIGSATTKAVIINHDSRLLGYAVMPTGGDNRKTTETVFTQALTRADIQREDVQQIFSTGYGRENILFADKHVTEITCHAIGINFLFPDTKTILDIGGQDTKGIQVDNEGIVNNFVMNDKCAAGTGRFLDVMAHVLGVQVEDLTRFSQESKSSIKISSLCTVFAESEVISLVAKGVPISDIIKGIHDAVAERSIILLRKLNIAEPITMSGGVANNMGLVSSLEEKLETKIRIPEHPQIIGALGAAILAQKNKKAVI
jgi:predicted CoA-substrate-specific enzyme activase